MKTTLQEKRTIVDRLDLKICVAANEAMAEGMPLSIVVYGLLDVAQKLLAGCGDPNKPGHAEPYDKTAGGTLN